MILNGTQITLAPLELTSDTFFEGVVTVITYPAGVEYFSHEGDGSFNGTNWQNTVGPNLSAKLLTITVIVTDETALSALPVEDRKVTAVTMTAPGETNTADNTQYRPVQESTCVDLIACVTIPVFDSMEEAFAELGAGAFFKYSPDNIDGATTGSVHITQPDCCVGLPPVFITCPGLTEYLCLEDVPDAQEAIDLGMITASGGCGPYTIEPVFESGTGPCPWVIERQYMVTDRCGTVSEICTWNITVDDTCVEGSGCDSPCPCEES